jgi:exopolyphosphatase/guanosine-5'-triphosphate,3'-diphosphate pyrophosphatase
VATAAVRDAANGGEFLEKVAALGLSPRLLSGEEEAVASARGVLSAFPGACGLVGDLGGGSLELIDIADNTCTHGVSLPLGTLRLPALRAEGEDRFQRRVAKMLRGAEWAAHPGQTLYLVGGSLRALARFAMVEQNWPIDDPHAYTVSGDEALAMTRRLADLVRSGGTVAPIAGVSASRLASLPEAGALLGVLVRELQPARVVFSGWGLREGLLAARMDADIAKMDPLLAGVSAFAEAQHAGLALAGRTVANWARAAAGASVNENLRLAATMLALASLASEPNVRAEQSVQWALRKRWLGVDAAGRAMIAMAVLANSGRVVVPEELLRLAPWAGLQQAVGWGLGIRLARRFSGGAGIALEASSLRAEGDALVLVLREDMASLYTDAVAKDLRILAEALGLRPVFQTA